MTSVAIIGAGMAGLAAARRLAAAGLSPVLLDKGRGIGGRMATRRAEGLQFDHGAQYVTARGSAFATLLRDMEGAGACAPWPTGRDPAPMVGTPGMSALPRALASGLEVRQGAQVTALHPGPQGWTLHLPGATLSADRVIVTVPAPQVDRMLPGHPLLTKFAHVRMEPCLTLMAAIAAPAPFVTRADADDPLAWIAHDGGKPGRADATAWVAQAGAAFSARYLEDDPAAMVARMLPLLCDRLGVATDRVTHASAHRWRFARTAAPLGHPFLRDDGGTLWLGGDWCLGPRVEDAWTSGTAMADDLLSRLP